MRAQPEFFRLLLEKGADVNTQDLRSYTPLMYALDSKRRRGRLWDKSRASEFVKLILGQDGVDIHRMAECGETALSLTVKNDFLEAADILRAHGAVWNASMHSHESCIVTAMLATEYHW